TRWRSARSMRDFISAAAASVNVTTSSSSTSQGSGASQTRYAHRSASTAVLPDPAAAETSRLRPVVAMPAHCALVQCAPCGIGGSFVSAGCAALRAIADLLDDLFEDLGPFHRL